MKTKQLLVSLILMGLPALSWAAPFQVQGGNLCERWVEIPSHGAYPIKLTCQVYGVYDVNSCQEAHERLKAENCCGGDRKIISEKGKCEAL